MAARCGKCWTWRQCGMPSTSQALLRLYLNLCKHHTCNSPAPNAPPDDPEWPDSPQPPCPNHQQRFFSRKLIRNQILRLDGFLLHQLNGRKQGTYTNKLPTLSGSRSNSRRLATHFQEKQSAGKSATKPTMQQMLGGMLPRHTRKMTLNVCFCALSMELILIWLCSGDSGFRLHDYASH